MMNLMRGLVCILSALITQFSTVDILDDVVEEIGQYVQLTIPDEESIVFTVGTFLSDKSGENLLGNRIQSILELYLVEVYSNATVVRNGVNRETFSISGDIQQFQEMILIVVRIVQNEGTIVGGTRVDIILIPELVDLLNPLQPFVVEKTPLPDDHYESDDNPGFEIGVEEG